MAPFWNSPTPIIIDHQAKFRKEWTSYLKTFFGRPTPLMYAARLSAAVGRGRIYLKREDLCHTGAHKINNALGQVLLAKHLGKKRIIAETGAGHTALRPRQPPLFLDCRVMCIWASKTSGARRRMSIACAGWRTGYSVHSGTQTLKDAIYEAMRDWSRMCARRTTSSFRRRPHPIPRWCAIFNRHRHGSAAPDLAERRRLPQYLVACVGGDPIRWDCFHPFSTTEFGANDRRKNLRDEAFERPHHAPP